MAEAHAKLSLRDSSVTVFDAVAAIKLYEENMASQCGCSFIEAYCSSNNVSNISIYVAGIHFIFSQVNQDMNAFWLKLEDFVAQYGSSDLSAIKLPETHEIPEE